MSSSTATQEIVAIICGMPAEFHHRGDISMVELVAKSGFDDSDGSSLRSAIEEQLRAHPQLIDDWATYSSDKRSDSGWYFEDRDSPLLGYYDPTIGSSQEQVFSDRARACTEFIIRELKAIRSSTA